MEMEIPVSQTEVEPARAWMRQIVHRVIQMLTREQLTEKLSMSSS